MVELTLNGIDSSRIVEEMFESSNAEFNLDQSSEPETEEEFALPEFREHFADALTPAVLKDWTAQDFANIYVRFRPHLERHAARFLGHSSQVEEVVQDAFLYLMTALPELDSELGVLKFLKWKVRMLAIDSMRSDRRRTFLPLDEEHLHPLSEHEVSEGLLVAEDSAVVSLALAKLSDRQRQALIATSFEEKPIAVAAAEMSLSQNAFRQLLYRARRSFRIALIGEASIEGKSLGQILGLASERHKGLVRSSGTIIASGLFLLFGINLMISPLINSQSTVAADGIRDSFALREFSGPLTLGGDTLSASDEEQASSGPSDVWGFQEESRSSAERAVNLEQATIGLRKQQIMGADASITEAARVQGNSTIERVETLRGVFAEESLLDLARGPEAATASYDGTKLQVSLDSGIDAFLILWNDGEQWLIEHAYFIFQIEGHSLHAVPMSDMLTTRTDGQRQLVSYGATDFVIGDLEGTLGFASGTLAELAITSLLIELELDSAGTIVGSSMEVVARPRNL